MMAATRPSIATVAGETVATSQVASDEAEMIRGKMLRPLAVIGDKPVQLEGFGTIPPHVAETIPGFTAPANYFGIFLPRGRAGRGAVATLAAAMARQDRAAVRKAQRAYAAKTTAAVFAPA